jgi:hypothetical protein
VNVEKELSRILEGRTDRHLIRELLGTNRPKNGADVAAFRRWQRGKEYTETGRPLERMTDC